MSKSKKIYNISLTAFAALAVCVFFGVKYPYHMHFQEQYQIFQFTYAYFAEVVRVPGGLSDYVGRFFTQFFYYSWAGAAIIAALLAVLQLLCYRCMERKNAFTYALSFFPSALLVVYFCDENALLSAPVALIISLLVALAVNAINNDKARNVVALLSVPILYLLCGSLSAAFVAVYVVRTLTAKRGAREYALCVAAVALYLASPLVSIYFFSYSFRRLMMGIHYYRYPYVFPAWAWMSLASLIVAVLVSVLKFTEQISSLVAKLCFVAVLALCTSMTLRAYDSTKEEIMKYDFMVRMNMWNRIMMSADVKNPSLPYTVACLNLALGKTGRMADHMFDYFQNGPSGLLPEFVLDHTSPLPTAEAFYQLGMINTSQRYTFEAQEAIPDFQKSARCYQQLAETNIINRDYKLAEKYLRTLSHTLFYREWANDRMALLYDDEAVNSHPEYGSARLMRLKERDFLFSDTEMDSMLGLMFLENKANTMAYDYLIAWTLLRKDLARFAEVLSISPYQVMPKSYQEAMALYLALSQVNPDSFPAFVSETVRMQLNNFITAMNSGKNEGYMQTKFGHTYWFYYYYRYR